MPEFEKVADINEIPAGGRKSIIVDELPALLVRVDDTYYALEDVCTHDGQPLADGPMSGCEITCPRHGARFDVRTGAVLCMPATEPITTFEVETREDGIYARPKSD